MLVRELLEGDAADADVVVVCGTGNNGGDGLVVARHLLVRHAHARVFLVGAAEKLSPDALANLEAWRGLGGAVHELPPESNLQPLEEAMADADVVVDALFGTGLDRAVEGFLAGVVRAMNAAPAPRFAVDLPSGLDADTGAALGVAVDAAVTVTFAHPKLGLLTPTGGQIAGETHVVDIGVPGELVAHVGGSAQLLEAADLGMWIDGVRRAPTRTPQATSWSSPDLQAASALPSSPRAARCARAQGWPPSSRGRLPPPRSRGTCSR